MKAPKLALTVSIQNSELRFNHPVIVNILVANESGVPVSEAELFISTPGFVTVHPGRCDSEAAKSAIDLGSLPAYSTIAQPMAICLKLVTDSGDSGAFNLLIGVHYRWEGGEGVVSTEKPVEVDLIGTNAILGVPIAFAGFVLPGLMFLITLRWFGLPWAKNLGAEDKLIYSVFISLLVLGPITLAAERIQIPSWLQLLNLQQAVSIERLVLYVGIGLAFGLLFGAVYRWDQKRKLEAEKRLNALKIAQGDSTPTLIYKALMLNPKYPAKKLRFEKKDGTDRVVGYHYALSGDALYVFSSFLLVSSRLDDEKQNPVQKALKTKDAYLKNHKQICDLVETLGETSAPAFMILDPAVRQQTSGSPGAVHNVPYLKLEPGEYLDVIYSQVEGYLLDISDTEPY